MSNKPCELNRSKLLTPRSVELRSCIANTDHHAQARSNVRVPVVYLALVYLCVFLIVEFCKITNLHPIRFPEGFDSHPGHQLASIE